MRLLCLVVEYLSNLTRNSPSILNRFPAKWLKQSGVGNEDSKKSEANLKIPQKNSVNETGKLCSLSVANGKTVLLGLCHASFAPCLNLNIQFLFVV